MALGGGQQHRKPSLIAGGGLTLARRFPIFVAAALSQPRRYLDSGSTGGLPVQVKYVLYVYILQHPKNWHEQKRFHHFFSV
jgi:hypothetical protein